MKSQTERNFSELYGLLFNIIVVVTMEELGTRTILLSLVFTWLKLNRYHILLLWY